MCAHCDLKVSSFQTKIDENYANYFFKTKTNNKWFIVQENDYRKVKENLILKSKPKALQHFKVDLVLKIDEPNNKQA